jgi:geranylgeranyl diphosphate synthase, type I
MTLDAWLGEVKSRVDAELARYFAEQRGRATGMSPPSVGLVQALERLTLRAGKRTRPALLFAGHAAVAESLSIESLLGPAAALELLQSYLLIHDDWMDQDDERRGGRTLHRQFAEEHTNAHVGASLAILAGDLANAFALELFSRGHGPEDRSRSALAVFAEMQADVVWGQALDVIAYPDVGLIHRLKTGSYSVKGPVLLGAVLGGSSAEQRAALERYAEPAGRAFQTRDDLLGTFGDPAKTGKPAGSDLRAGKRTALIEEAESRLPSAERTPLDRVLGRRDADDRSIEQARSLLEASGVRAAVEDAVLGYYAEATAALEGAPLLPAGKQRLAELVRRFALRDR